MTRAHLQVGAIFAIVAIGTICHVRTVAAFVTIGAITAE
jgi:hypothetical protein